MRLPANIIHHAPPRNLAALMRRGIGQSGPAGYSSCAAYLAGTLAAFPPVSTAASLGPVDEVLSALQINPGVTSAATAANVVYSLAQQYCGAIGAESSEQDPNIPTAPDCSDGGQSAATAAYPAYLAYYSALPASFWTAIQTLASTPETVAVSPAIVQQGSYTAPTYVTVTPTSMPNPTSVAQAQQQVQQLITGAPVSSSPASSTSSGSSTSGGTTSSSSSGTSTAAPWYEWFTETSIDSIPNWALVAGGVALIVILPMLLGGKKR
jgi:hypothetical protein